MSSLGTQCTDSRRQNKSEAVASSDARVVIQTKGCDANSLDVFMFPELRDEKNIIGVVSGLSVALKLSGPGHYMTLRARSGWSGPWSLMTLQLSTHGSTENSSNMQSELSSGLRHYLHIKQYIFRFHMVSSYL